MSIRILLVEDNPADAAFVTELLLSEEEDDYEVEHVKTLAAARDRLFDRRFDSVLLDLGLPDSEGLDTLKILAASNRDLPIVVLTGFDDTNLGQRAVQAGAQDFLIKNQVSGDSLRRIVRYSCERLKARRQYEALDRYHELILRAVGEGVVGVGNTGEITFANDIAAQSLGWGPGELIGRQSCEVFCPKAAEQGGCARCFDKGNLSTRSNYEEERVFRRRDGSVFPVETVCTVLEGNDENRGVVIVFRDITKAVERQRELEHMRRLYGLILDSAGEGIYGVDAKGCTTFINQAATQMLGWDADELIGRQLHDVIHHTHPDGSPHQARDCPIYGSFSDGKIHHQADDVFWRRDGTSFPVAYVSTPILEDGMGQGAVVVFHDITQRKEYEKTVSNQKEQLEELVAKRTEKLSQEIGERIRTEAALRESQNRMRAITGSLFEGVLVVDENGHIVFANPSAEHLLMGPEDGHLAGRDLDTVMTQRIDGDEVGFADSPLYQVADKGTVVTDDDAVFVSTAGELLHVAYACSPLVENGQQRGAILSFRDIRELKAAQRDALQASKLASVGQLAAGIAHEINTPTQYIGDNLRFIGESFADIAAVFRRHREFVQSLQAPPELGDRIADLNAAASDADADYLLDEIPEAAKQSLEGVAQVARIVLAMKEFSHPGEKEKVATDVNRALENTVTVCKNEWKHFADVDLDFNADLPQVVCLVGELNQVFLNLIVNAAHAIEAKEGHEKGRITVRTRSEDGTVAIDVEDDGIGMSPETREHIFEPFFTTKEVGRGTGQGLAICRDIIVNKHGGQIHVDSEEGRGTRFTLLLPTEDSSEVSGGEE